MFLETLARPRSAWSVQAPQQELCHYLYGLGLMMRTWYGDCFVPHWSPTVMVKKKGQHILGENHLKTEQGLYKNHNHTSSNQVVDMLWLNFILGLNFIFLCFGVWKCMIMTFKQTEIKLQPRIKLSHNRYVANFFHGVHVQCR